MPLQDTTTPQCRNLAAYLTIQAAVLFQIDASLAAANQPKSEGTRQLVRNGAAERMREARKVDRKWAFQSWTQHRQRRLVQCLAKHSVDEDDRGRERFALQGETGEVLYIDRRQDGKHYQIHFPVSGAVGWYNQAELEHYFNLTPKRMWQPK